MKFAREWAGRQWTNLKPRMMLPLTALGVFWAAYALDKVLPVNWELKNLGVRPWSSSEPMNLGGLTGIPFAPFLHANLEHIRANTLNWAVLGWVTALSGRGVFLRVFAFTALTSGLGCWLFGNAESVHIGASGVIFGMLGFLLARGWYARRIGWSLVALVVGFEYFGIVFSLFTPMLRSQLSWSMHFWGFAGGIGLSWWMYGRTNAASQKHASLLPSKPEGASKATPSVHR